MMPHSKPTVTIIVTNPEFIEAIADELRGGREDKKKSSPTDEEDSEDDDVSRRVRHKIALRMRQRHAEYQR